MTKNKISKRDLQDWKNFLEKSNNIVDKDINKESSIINRDIFKFDFHGFSIDSANKKVAEIIKFCYEQNIYKILLITGKGSHSKSDADVYASKEFSILKNTIPEFIKNTPDLSSKIIRIEVPDRKFGGEGALLLFLKKLENKF